MGPARHKRSERADPEPLAALVGRVVYGEVAILLELGLSLVNGRVGVSHCSNRQVGRE